MSVRKNNTIFSTAGAKSLTLVLSVLILSSASCRRTDPEPPSGSDPLTVTIFSVNDVHAQIDNFGKLKYIVDQARLDGEVYLVSCGDIFSGNPVVDFIEPKGYSIIDLMNRSGFDVAVLGNHEFDYGETVLSDRMAQAEFDFILANADMSLSVIPQPDPYVTLQHGEARITFLGLVQTSMTNGLWLPATHPLKVENITFSNAFDVIHSYSPVKEESESDLLVLLSHLGTGSDHTIATQNSWIDVIIGGHSHQLIDETVNGIPIYQCGSYLRNIGKITLTIRNGAVEEEEFELISLGSYPFSDSSTDGLIDQYNDTPELDEVIGYSESYLSRGSGLGCMYTDILRLALDADLSFQNGGGLRADINQGDITVREIYSVDPFNNGARIYNMTVESIERFLNETGAGFHYSGVIIEDEGGDANLKWPDGTTIPDNTMLKLGINDYIPSVYADYFSDPVITGKTTAEEIIGYLRDHTGPIDYGDCARYY